MKKIIIILLAFAICCQLSLNATTYTYTSTNSNQSDWTLVSNWSPTYPGTTINAADSVIVSGWVNVNTNVQMNGTMLTTNFVQSWYDGIMILGSNTLVVGSTGTIHNEGHIRLRNTAQLQINGFVDISGSTLDALMMDDNASVIIQPGGNLYIEDSIWLNYNYNTGAQCSLTVNGTLTNDGIIYNNTGSVINGTGSIVTSTSTANGNIVGVGSVAPGLSPGELKTDFDYTLSSNGSLDIEIGGIIPGTDYDVLGGTGNKTLGGTLNVSLYNGFVPPVGYTATIVKGSTITGTFSSINYPPLPNNMTWDIEYNATEVILIVNAATGIRESELAARIELYPNPTTGSLNFKGLSDNKLSFAIYTVTGSLVQSGKLSNTSSLDLICKETGFYYLVLNNEKGQVVKAFSIVK